ncbi:hypothetical protein [Archangium sp.]|uniref:hypothetical protein n=1 Tax=Archangium sp. TaxID=1872627 RepID=UPI00389A671D
MITFDDSQWPLLRVTFSGTSSSQVFAAYLSRMSAYLNRGEKYLAILDTRAETTAPTMEQRQLQVEWIQRHEVALRQRSLGTAFIITSPFIRLALNIIYQLKPLPCPHTIVSDLQAARDWAAGRFRAAGLVLPTPRVEAQRLGRTGAQGPG